MMTALLGVWGLAKGFLGAVSLRAWLIVGAVVAVLWLVHSNRVARDAAHQARAAAAVHAATALEQEKARGREQELNAQLQGAQDEYRKNLADAQRRSAGAVRAERERLLDALAPAPGSAASASAPAASGTDGTAALREVVRECSGVVQALESDVETVAAKLAGLQSYVRAVCPGPAR